MYGGKFFLRIFVFLMNGERGCCLELFMCECFERNGSAQSGSKAWCKREALDTYRTAPKSRAKAAIDCKYSVLGILVILCPVVGLKFDSQPLRLPVFLFSA